MIEIYNFNSGGVVRHFLTPDRFVYTFLHSGRMKNVSFPSIHIHPLSVFYWSLSLSFSCTHTQNIFILPFLSNSLARTHTLSLSHCFCVGHNFIPFTKWNLNSNSISIKYYRIPPTHTVIILFVSIVCFFYCFTISISNYIWKQIFVISIFACNLTHMVYIYTCENMVAIVIILIHFYHYFAWSSNKFIFVLTDRFYYKVRSLARVIVLMVDRTPTTPYVACRTFWISKTACTARRMFYQRGTYHLQSTHLIWAEFEPKIKKWSTLNIFTLFTMYMF